MQCQRQGIHVGAHHAFHPAQRGVIPQRIELHATLVDRRAQRIDRDVRADLVAELEQVGQRFLQPVDRQLDVLDRRLAESEYIAGADYTIADMAIWPWYGALVKGLVYDAGTFLQVHEYKNVLRWTDQIAERPAVKRGRMVNRVMGDPASQLHERHDASDFDTKTQDKIAPDNKEAQA